MPRKYNPVAFSTLLHPPQIRPNYNNLTNLRFDLERIRSRPDIHWWKTGNPQNLSHSFTVKLQAVRMTHHLTEPSESFILISRKVKQQRYFISEESREYILLIVVRITRHHLSFIAFIPAISPSLSHSFSPIYFSSNIYFLWFDSIYRFVNDALLIPVSDPCFYCTILSNPPPLKVLCYGVWEARDGSWCQPFTGVPVLTSHWTPNGRH